MRKRRVSSSFRASRSAAVGPYGEKVRFLGLSLSGGKADKAALAILDYYPHHQKIFLAQLHSHLSSQTRPDGDLSADAKLYELIAPELKTGADLAVDSPWRQPLCLKCKLSCPGYELCKEEQIQWMAEHYRALKKRPKKIFTPYTQRCFEMYAATELEEPFQLNSPMGANAAPLLARAAFLLRRLSCDAVEVSPQISIWRIGRSLGVAKSHLRSHRRSAGGDESRKAFMKALAEHGIAFVYAEDVQEMIANNHAFEAFVCALTLFLKSKGWSEKRPSGFPKNEDWVQFPLQQIPWKDM